MEGSPHIFTLKLQIAPGDAAGFEMWRMGVAPMFEMEAHPSQARPEFFFDCVTHQFADATVASASSAATRFDRNQGTIARGGLDSVSVLTYLDGGAVLTANGRDTQMETGDVCILDMTQTCTLVTTPYTHLSFVMPRATLAEFMADIDGLHGLVLRRGTPMSSLLVSHMQTLLAEAPDLSMAETRAAVRGTAALAAACVGTSRGRRASAGAVVAATSLQAVRRVIEDNLGSADLDPDFLVRRFGVSRATLYRLLAPLGGVRGYIQRRRLTRAYQAIVEAGDERIGAIALRHGFPSDAAFSRAFRKVYGMSPSDLRATAEKGAAPARRPENSRHGFTRVNRWLLGLDNQGR